MRISNRIEAVAVAQRLKRQERRDEWIALCDWVLTGEVFAEPMAKAEPQAPVVASGDPYKNTAYRKHMAAKMRKWRGGKVGKRYKSKA